MTTPVVDEAIRAELDALSARFEREAASAPIEWAVERFGSAVSVAASFEDAVLIDLAVSVEPRIEIVFLDTQFHFAETLWFVDHLKKRYDLNLRVVEPLVAKADLWRTDLAGCCQARKVEPLNRALSGRAAWITGLRRVDAPTRADAPIVSWDEVRGMVKLNPLAPWTDADMSGYIADHDLPENPLAERGILSVGCWPCTRPVAPGEDRRAGRWAGSNKVECGLHL